jgi:MYXO-CTERM domain-containing protein
VIEYPEHYYSLSYGGPTALSQKFTLERVTKGLLATTCLTIASSSVASAATITEGTSPAPIDFPNTSNGFLLPVGTTSVIGLLAGEGDPADWFQFQSLLPGGSYSVHGFYNPSGQEDGLRFALFNSSGTQLGSIGSLEIGGDVLTGTIPNNGVLVAEVFGGSNGIYELDLTAQLGSVSTPEPATVATTGLALAGLLEARRRRRNRTTQQ